jgi:methionyl aminopeptidase
VYSPVTPGVGGWTALGQPRRGSIAGGPLPDKPRRVAGEVKGRLPAPGYEPAGCPAQAPALCDNPPMAINLKTPEELEQMRVAGRLAAEVLQVVAPHVRPGVTTAELDRVCHDHIVNVQQAIPANIGYGGGHGRIPFPFTVCTSVNNVICHGMPSEGKTLKDGDIVNIDVTVIKDGWHGDTSRMYYAGTPSVMAKRLVETTREALFRGIRMVRPGATLGDIGHAIQQYAESQRFSVVREYCGHGIGKVYHDEPQVLHYGRPGDGIVLKPGMTFTIEPMINEGTRHTRLLPDGWTVVTKDRKLSAQWEHTVAVTEDGVEILTRLPGDDNEL